MTDPSLPLADAGSFSAQARRTRVLRLALAAAIALAAVAAVLLARGPHASAGPYVPQDTNTIVVLDVSQSVELDKLRLAYSTLSFLGHSNARIGLILTSSYSYEALPPGSPADALLPIARLFHATKVRRGPFGGPASFALPPNPWRSAFSSGTELSSGLSLARSIIADNHLSRPRVVLISDLLDDSEDLPNVTSEGEAFQRLGIPLRIVSLAPTFGDLQFFLKAAGPQASLLQPRAPTQAIQLRSGFPTPLVVVAALLAVLLAIDELLFAPLRWGRSRLVGEARA